MKRLFLYVLFFLLFSSVDTTSAVDPPYYSQSGYYNQSSYVQSGSYNQSSYVSPPTESGYTDVLSIDNILRQIKAVQQLLIEGLRARIGILNTQLSVGGGNGLPNPNLKPTPIDCIGAPEWSECWDYTQSGYYNQSLYIYIQESYYSQTFYSWPIPQVCPDGSIGIYDPVVGYNLCFGVPPPPPPFCPIGTSGEFPDCNPYSQVTYYTQTVYLPSAGLCQGQQGQLGVNVEGTCYTLPSFPPPCTPPQQAWPLCLNPIDEPECPVIPGNPPIPIGEDTGLCHYEQSSYYSQTAY